VEAQLDLGVEDADAGVRWQEGLCAVGRSEGSLVVITGAGDPPTGEIQLE
jgi:hypothetical protein